MSAGNGRDTAIDITPDDIASKAWRAAEHALQQVDGLRDRMDERFDALEARSQVLAVSLAAVERNARDRGHAHADALLVLTADVSTLRTRVDAQEDLHAQRHRMLLDELRALRSDLALTRSKALSAADDAREARASRPDDGRLSEIAARVLEAAADDRDIENERKRESIRARGERRSAVLRWVGQVVGWLTVGGGVVLALQHC